MPIHNPRNINALNKQGVQAWSFGLRYELPDKTLSQCSWYGAVAAADLASEATHNNDVWGIAQLQESSILFLVEANGIYSEALEHATQKVNQALAAGSLSACRLVELTYLYPDSYETSSR